MAKGDALMRLKSLTPMLKRCYEYSLWLVFYNNFCWYRICELVMTRPGRSINMISKPLATSIGKSLSLSA
eukprot:g6676.t1